MQKNLTLTVEEVEGVSNGHLIKFIGDFDATNVDEVMDTVFGLFVETPVNLIADFKDLRYINSTGLGILLQFSKYAKEKSGTFKVCHMNANVTEIVELVGARPLIDIYETRDAAIASCQ